MSLLQDIQNAAVDANTPIATLLRRCAVLASRLNNAELRAWAANELNGYGEGIELPPYRIVAAPAHGHLAGPFGSGYKNITIPPAVLPENSQQYAKLVQLRQPIAELEALAQSDGELMCSWPGNLIAYMQTDKGNKFAGGLILYAAWQSLSKAQVLGIIDTVRNRVLEFALQLEKEAPAAGEPENPGSTVSDARVTQIYQTTIHGDVIGNVATGSHAVQSANAISVVKGDLDSLRKALAAAQVPVEEITELEAALNEDPPATTLPEKPKTWAWVRKIAQKIQAGALKLSEGVTVEMVAEYLVRYLGLLCSSDSADLTAPRHENGNRRVDVTLTLVPFLAAIVAWLANEWRKTWWEQYQRKERSYEALLRASRGFYVGQDSKQHKTEFLEQLDRCWLYCADDVIRKGYTFLEAVKNGSGSTESERQLVFAAFVIAMRKDLLAWRIVQRTKLQAADYRLYKAN